MAHAAWIKSLKWAAVGDALLLATGCSEGGVRLYTALRSTFSALPDLLNPALSSSAQDGSPQHHSGEAEKRTGRQSAQQRGDSSRPAVSAPVVRLMHVAVQPDLRSVICMDLHVDTTDTAGDIHSKILFSTTCTNI